MRMLLLATTMALCLAPYSALADKPSKPAKPNLDKLTAAAKTHLAGTIGDPTSISWMNFDLVGERQWAPTPPHTTDSPRMGAMYTVLVAKFRAKNDAGAMQVFHRAVLFKPGTNEAEADVDYPTGWLRDLSTPDPLTTTMVDMAAGKMIGKGSAKKELRESKFKAKTGPEKWLLVHGKKDSEQQEWYSADGGYAIKRSAEGWELLKRVGGKPVPIDKDKPAVYSTQKEAMKAAQEHFRDALGR